MTGVQTCALPISPDLLQFGFDFVQLRCELVQFFKQLRFAGLRVRAAGGERDAGSDCGQCEVESLCKQGFHKFTCSMMDDGAFPRSGRYG